MTSAQRAFDVGALAGRRVVLGVTGGIAAYKAVEIASRLKKAGADVRVIMTRAATSFVTPLTFREITGQPVTETMWGEPHHHVEHIALAEFAELVLVAPATANFIAKAAAGIADDMLTTSVLATRAPLLIAPAMNTGMWENPVTQENVEIPSQYREQGGCLSPWRSFALSKNISRIGRALRDGAFSSRRRGRRRHSTPCASSATARRGVWALRLPPRRRGAARR